MSSVAAIESRAVALLREGLEQVELKRAADIDMAEIDWLWPDWLAKGKLHLLAGDGGTGKTTLALAIASTVSAGGNWPDGATAPSGNVLIWSGEDDAADTIVPRLRAAGADVDKVYVVGDVRSGHVVRPFDPAQDLELLAAEAQRIGSIALLIVDPVVSAIAGDGHKNVEVRRSLQPLVDLAEQLGSAVIGISHFSKGGGGNDPLLRVTGSVAFGAVARVVFVAAKKRDADYRVFARAKSNIGPDEGGYTYRIDISEGPFSASYVTWGEVVDGPARDLLADENTYLDGTTESAGNWLQEVLTRGPLAVAVLKGEAQKQGFSWRTLERAKQSLGIRSRKDSEDGGWRWSLPAAREDRQPRHIVNDGLGGVEQLVGPSAERVCGSSGLAP